MDAKLKIKRIYLPAEEDDGYRILIDRLWPRGVSKTNAGIDEWAKEVTPSTELRKWFGHKERTSRSSNGSTSQNWMLILMPPVLPTTARNCWQRVMSHCSMVPVLPPATMLSF